MMSTAIRSLCGFFSALLLCLLLVQGAKAQPSEKGAPTVVEKKEVVPDEPAEPGELSEEEITQESLEREQALEQAAQTKELEAVAKEKSEKEAAEAKKLLDAAEALAALEHVELLSRAGEIESELQALNQAIEIPKKLGLLRKDLASRESGLTKKVAGAREDILEAARWFILTDIRFEFTGRLLELQSQRRPLDTFSSVVQLVPERVEAIIREWAAAREILTKVKAPPTVLNRVDELLRKAHLLSLRLGRAQSAIAQTGAVFERMETAILGILRFSEIGAPTLLTDFSHRNEPGEQGVFPEELWRVIQGEVRRQRRSWRAFIKIERARIIFHLLLLGGLIFALRKAREHYAPVDSEELDEKHLLVRHPWSGAILISAFATIFIYDVMPSVAAWATLALAVVGASFILLEVRDRGSKLFVGGALMSTFFVLAHMGLSQVPLVAHWVVGVEGVFVLALIVQLMRLPTIRWEGNWNTFAQFVMRFWIAAAIFGLVVWFLGYDRSSAILIDGTVRLMLTTVAFRISYDLLASVLRLGVESPWAQKSHALKSQGPFIAERATFILRIVLLALWFRAAATAYTLLSPAKDMFESLFEHSISAGSLSVELGSIFVLVVGIIVAVAAARFTRFALEQDMLPRTELSEGTQAAVSSSIFYIILGFGLFTTMVAVGFELDKITILVSALGVGIGFGLQNIVQNFVAGIILIFGRPINVGDRVQLDDLVGRVRKVGFRASTVRTIQGAEVIVPNSQFVSEQVINWSLSDDQRRVDVDVGVKYGTDPQRVLDILLAAAAAHPEVLDFPKTEAIFVAFGESSLDFQLRAWTGEGGRWINIRSDLAVAINGAFKEADIEIPFPQRDLHLRSIDESVSQKIEKSKA